MSAIASVVPSAAPASAAGGASATGGSDGDSFSRLLQGGGNEGAPQAGSAGSAATDKAGAPRRAVQGGREDAGQQAASGDAGKRAKADPAAEDTATPATGEADGQRQAAASEDRGEDAPADGGWPPPGLASLLGPAPATATVATAPVAAVATAPVVANAVSLPAADAPALPAAPENPTVDGQAGGPAPPAALLANQAVSGARAEPASVGAQAGQAEALSPSAALPLPASVLSGSDTPAAPTPVDSGLQALATTLDAAAAGADPADLSAFQLALQNAAPAPATTATPTTPPLAAPDAPIPNLHGGAFADEIGTQVEWLAGQKISHAQIRISPENLGPVEVRLKLDGDRISADFSSAQPEVRQALESGLPRLREMLGQHGFQLAHAGVGQQSQSSQGQAGQTGGAGTGTGNGEEGDAASAEATPASGRTVLRRGLVDAYA